MAKVTQFRRRRLTWHTGWRELTSADDNAIVVPAEFQPSWLYLGFVENDSFARGKEEAKFVLEVRRRVDDELALTRDDAPDTPEEDGYTRLLPRADWGDWMPAALFTRGPDAGQHLVDIGPLHKGDRVRLWVEGGTIGWATLDGMELEEEKEELHV